MRAWAILLGGLVVWVVHFFAVYGIASILPGQPAARWLILAVTLSAVAAEVLVVRCALEPPAARDALHRWASQLGAIGGALSLIAVLWQAMPALVG
jgi:hypothetical protein